MDATLYQDQTNVPYQKDIVFKFFPDAANQPTVPTSPLNIFITSIVRVSQGLYRITFVHPFRNLATADARLNVNGAGVARFAQPGPVANLGTATPVTLDILVVDNAGAVQDPPAANANNFISGTATFCDTGPV